MDTSLLPEMKRYGAFDISACFNCGNCTAVCPLSEGSVAFPRRAIRYAQLGQRPELAASREIWLCYYCAQCSDTCPRQAEPGAFMAAARRFATASFDPTTISRRLNRSASSAVAIVAVLFAALLAIMLAWSPGLPEGAANTSKLLEFVPYEAIHWLGVGVVTLAAFFTTMTLANMLWMISRAPTPGALAEARRGPRTFPLSRCLQALRFTLAEIVSQRRYRDCDSGREQPQSPLPLRRWFIHYAIMGGMVGLVAATILDLLFKEPGSFVPIYSPIRLLGTIAGLFLVYGASVVIVQRLRRADRYHAQNAVSDLLLIGFLWIIGVSGFVLELAEYAPIGRSWIAVVFLAHVALAMELILLLPFSKLGHLIYRPVAIWFNEFRRLGAVGDHTSHQGVQQ